jgi:hypothetical protein
MTLEITERKTSWVYLIPVSGLLLTQAVDEEFSVGRVTFVTARRLARVRRRLGLPKPLSEVSRGLRWAPLENEAKVLAVVRETGRPKDIDAGVQRRVTEALQILAVSQLSYSKRRRNAFPTIDNTSIRTTDRLCVDGQTGDRLLSSRVSSKFFDLVLDERWRSHHKRVFFWDLWRILEGEIKVKTTWRETLRTVAVLVGQSQTSNDLAQAFLLDVIALEALLAVQGDKYLDALPERVEAFIGWVGFWRTRNYESRIREAYKKRCQYVHAGDASTVEVADLLFMDEIVLNVLMNIVAHPKLFASKDDVVEFAKKVSAERVLGITGTQSKVRPKTFRSVARNYSADDLRMI